MTQLDHHDIDGDGDEDFIYTNVFGIEFRENLGPGVGFAPGQSVTSMGIACNAVCVGDIDGDGSIDILGGSDTPDFIFWQPNGLAPLVGSGADLTLDVGPLAMPNVSVLTGQPFPVHLSSPLGTYNQAVPILAAQVSLFGAAVSPIPFMPEVHLDPGASAPYPIAFLYNGYTQPVLPMGLQPSGLDFWFQIPVGVPPAIIRMQAFVLAPNAGNAVFTSTDAHAIRIL